MRTQVISVSRRWLCSIGLVAAAVAAAGCPAAETPAAEIIDGASALDGASAVDAAAASLPADAGSAPDAGTIMLRPTHSGLVSLQEVTLADALEQTPLLTFQASLAPATRPDFEELPGEVTGCKAWSYDLDARPLPADEDQGVLAVAGLTGGDLRCVFEGGRYGCAAAAVPSSAQPGSVLADLRAYALPLTGQLALTLTGGRSAAFDDATAALTPGSAFTIDAPSRTLLSHFPITEEAVTLSCEGPGGSCGTAAATIVRITANDGDPSGLPATTVPRPRRRAVEISCASLGKGTLTIPAGAMKLLAQAHAASPLRRIRTAFMRDGVSVLSNGAGRPPNRLIFVSGRASIGYTSF